jgi:hypothetical protein
MGRHRQRKHDLIRILLFFQNKESRLKIDLEEKGLRVCGLNWTGSE